MSSPDQCNILHLNDDCFYHIYQFLPILDWCSLRDTCTRFRTISDYCFERRSETFELKRDISDNWRKLVLSEVKRVLRCFGGFMKTLSINQNHFERRANCSSLMPYLDRYCQSLVDLELVKVNLNLTTIEQCSRMFTVLHRLVIDKWDDVDEEAFSGCLAKCTSLKELEFIRFGIAGNSLASNRIESLESFKMSRCDDLNYEAVKSFLTTNCQLTQVKLFDLLIRDRSILEHIANALPRLEALSLHFYASFGLNIDLKHVELVADNILNQVLSGLAVYNSSEDLHLAQFECTDESIGLLSSLKTLKILKLTKTNRLDGDQCKRLASGLPGLDEIHLFECKDTSFNEVKEFVSHIPNLTRIAFNRPKDRGPSIKPEMFCSLVEIRKRQATKRILSIFLNDNDLRDIKNASKSTGKGDIIAEHNNVVKMLPLDKEHRRAVSEYGSGVLSTVRTNPLYGGRDIYSDSYDDSEIPGDFVEFVGCVNGRRKFGRRGTGYSTHYCCK